MPHAVTILADGFEEIEAVSFIDLLRRAHIRVKLLGLETQDVRGSHDIYIHTDSLLKDFSDKADAIILPGGMPGTSNLLNSIQVIEMVQQFYKNGLLCAAICAAPIVLGKAGILKNKQATCYPGNESKLNGGIFTNSIVVRDTNIITSRGVGTAIAFALELIKYLSDDEAATRIASAILYD